MSVPEYWSTYIMGLQGYVKLLSKADILVWKVWYCSFLFYDGYYDRSSREENDSMGDQQITGCSNV